MTRLHPRIPYRGSPMIHGRRASALVAIFSLVVAVTGMCKVGEATAATPRPDVPEPAAWIVVDGDTGSVLHAHNEHEPLPTASIAKVMTGLVALERLGPGSKISVSALAASQPPSKLGVTAGETYKLQDALAALMLTSANDVAYAIAETVGGDLAGFATLLNATAKRYGMNDSTLSDPAGFDDANSFRGGPRVSAFDIAISVRNAQAAPALAKWASTPSYTFDGPNARFNLNNHNKLLPGGERETPGVTGFKTGGTALAGSTLATTATRDGRSLIVVVLNTPDTYSWTQYLLDLGFDTPTVGVGTGEKLPTPKVSLQAQRERDRDEFVALVTGVSIGKITQPTNAPSNLTSFATTNTTAAVGSVSTVGAEPAGPDREGGGGSATTVILLVIGAGAVGVFGRREQIRRRKLRRARLRRERAAMIRRGSLNVVDQRARGVPVRPNGAQTHIRVQRAEASLEDDWEEWKGWDDEPPGRSH